MGPAAEAVVRTAESFSPSELNEVVQRLVQMRAKQSVSSLPEAETRLLLRINRRLPAERLARYEELITRREDEVIDAAEMEELRALTEEVETFEVERVQDMAELAALRNLSLRALAESLGIGPRVRE
jgi:hypothetical protein